MVEHKIYTEELEDNPNRSYWECSCGSSGSASSDRVDLASDKHLKDGDTRIDTNRPL
jgi:hypothetical protein